MIVFAALIPHTPLLIETIGKENTKKLKNTLNATDILADHLEKANIETCLVLSSHGSMSKDSFSMNLHSDYEINFSEFGDLVTKDAFLPDLELMSVIQREARKKSIPLRLYSKTDLDYGTSVALSLMKKTKKTKIIPLSPGTTNAKAHFVFGQKVLKDPLHQSKKRIAIIATGDLSHTLTSSSPAGFHKDGKVFDELIRSAASSSSSSKLLSIDEEMVRVVNDCSYYSFLMLAGCLNSMSVKPEELSYEAPFGVGHLVTAFHF